MPYLSEDYGLMPWHFGGPAQLTYDEAESYVNHFKKKKEAEAREAKAARRQQGHRRGGR